MKKLYFLFLTVLIISTFGLFNTAQAQLILTDDFSYVTGTNITANGWTAHSGGGTNPIKVSATGLTFSGYAGSGIGLAATFTTSGEDDNRSFSAFSSGSLYASAMINLTSAQATGDYFFHFNTGTAIVTRLFAKSSGAGYVLGISKGSEAAVYSGTVLSFNTTYLVVIKYTFIAGATNDEVDLFLNPTPGAAEPVPTVQDITITSTDATSLTNIAIRQGSGTAAPAGQIDGIRVGTTWASVTPALGGVATKFAITSINGGSSPSDNTPFTVTIQSQDALGSAANVVSSTSFDLSLTTGSGSLAGTISGTITAGSSAVTISGATYSKPESGVSITANGTGGDDLAPGTSALFNVLEKANNLVFVGVPAAGTTGAYLTSFTVEARRTDNSVDLNYTGSITLSKASGSGTLYGTLTKSAVSGVASFGDVYFYDADTYTITPSATGLTGTASGGIVITPGPMVTENIVPLYCGSNVSNSRNAAVALVTFSNLTDGTSYDFHSGGNTGTGTWALLDGETGAGLVTTPTNGSTYVTAFTASGTTKTLYVILYPSTNAAFNPGSLTNIHYFLRVTSGATVVNDFVGQSITCLSYAPSGSAALLKGTSFGAATQDKFVFAWDNETGTGRPLAGYVGENNLISEIGYPTNYSLTTGDYGFLIPSTNANGVRRLASYGSSGSMFALLDVATNPAGFTGTVNPTAGNDVPITSDIAPLPVELSSFTASVKGSAVLLNWATATEIKNQGFDVERSNDNSTWTKLTFVKGNGNSNSTKNYSFTDNTVSKSGKYYYRLKQVDNDGSFKYSNTIQADFVKPIEYSLDQNFPNPFNPNTVISYALPEAANVKLIIYNAIGQTVKVLENGYKSEGIYKVSFNATELPSGIYFYRLDAGKFSQIKKMLLIK